MPNTGGLQRSDQRNPILSEPVLDSSTPRPSPGCLTLRGMALAARTHVDSLKKPSTFCTFFETFVFTALVVFSVSSSVLAENYAVGNSVPPTPSALFHWTNNKRLEPFANTLQRGELPLKASVQARDGTWDMFSAAQPHLIGTPILFTWSDIVGGMGATRVEFYAKLDLEKNIKPRLIGAAIDPEARVKKVISVYDVTAGQFSSYSSKPIELRGVDLIYHEFHQTDGNQPPSEKTRVLREWIIVPGKAATEVFHHPASFRNVLEDGLRRVRAGGPIERHSFLPFTHGHSQARAEDVLNYVLFKTPPTCIEAFSRTAERSKW